MRHRIFFHLVWTTRDRAPLLDLGRAEFLGRYLRTVARQERVQIWAMGIVSTHVHLLLRADPAARLSPLVQRFKGGSSTLIGREHIGELAQLRWAPGCNMESVSPSAVEQVRAYVESQAQQHPMEAIAGWPVMPTREIGHPGSGAIAELVR